MLVRGDGYHLDGQLRVVVVIEMTSCGVLSDWTWSSTGD